MEEAKTINIEDAQKVIDARKEQDVQECIDKWTEFMQKDFVPFIEARGCGFTYQIAGVHGQVKIQPLIYKNVG